ncbi:hypothetical protein LTR84_003888 [Exophiala bonariae]|uniref:Uncharacterized protein n=1 Tax=Exophiala bonariae TaxID=1690606 RepID=A0AAV9N6I5_9EURO|nr:hypothetical protein LTR84_003888 [Exophiala bonariae]
MVVTRLQLRRDSGEASPTPDPPRYRLRKGVRRSRRFPGAQGFKLLELPWEIRQIILRDLLWLPEPVYFHSDETQYTGSAAMRTVDDPGYEDYWTNIRENKGEGARKFYPEVLAVCKQLYEEGSPILYDNSVKCEVGNESDDFSSPFITMHHLAERYGPSSEYELDLPESVLKKMRRAYIEVVTFSGEMGGEETYSYFQDVLEEFIDVLHVSNWKHLTLKLKIDPVKLYEGPPYEDPRLRDALFRQFLSLRDCSEVSISGISPSLATELERMMTSSSAEHPVMNLGAMHWALLQYTGAVTGVYSWAVHEGEQENILKEHIRVLVDTMGNHVRDVQQEDFMRARRQVLQHCTQLMLWRQSQVFLQDLDSTSYEPQGTTLNLDDGNQLYRIKHLELPPDVSPFLTGIIP